MDADEQEPQAISERDRRTETRYLVDQQASVLVVGHGMSFKGRILNLSLNGCCLQSSTQLPGGGQVRVEVTFSINGDPFRMGGAIRWSDGDQMGIQFVRVSRDRQAEWVRVIESRAEQAAEEIAARSTPPAGDAELIQIVEANLGDAGRRAGLHLACRVGCTQCCHGAFAINALDALRLRSGMLRLRTSAPETAAAVEQRAEAWLREYGGDFPGDTATGILGASEEDQARFEDFANDAACPALDVATGRCDVYAWRPMTCRVFGPPVRAVGDDGQEVLGHCELCFVGASNEEIAACEMAVPHELEAELVKEVGEGETVVAFALLK